MHTSQRLSAREVVERAYCIPLGSPSYAPLPLKILERQQLVITYRTDPERARRLVPEPLEVEDPIVSVAFIYNVEPSLGDYCEVTQSITARFRGEAVSFRPAMYAENVPAVLIGREVWGLPKKFGNVGLGVNGATYIGTFHFDGVLVARATMGYRYAELDPEQVRKWQTIPGIVLKIMPHVDGSPRILELVRIAYSDVVVKGAWTGPGALELHPHALAPLAELPVREIVSVSHSSYDALLARGEVVHDYLAG